MSGLECTRCGDPTHSEPDAANTSISDLMVLTSNWMCNDCLDDAELTVKHQRALDRENNQDG